MPDLSAPAVAGERLFAANCAECHGQHEAGTEKGPPIIHVICYPGNHPDAAFHGAVAKGVHQHHWPFGNMPPQPHLTTDDIASIIRFVREVQAANGIVYPQHQM